VWILSPVPTPTETPTDTTMAEQPVEAVAAALDQQQTKQEQPMEIDPSPSFQQCDDSDDVYIPVPVGLRIPGYLLRVLSSSTKLDAFSSSSSPSSSPELDPVGLLVLMTHAAMLETGFSRHIDPTQRGLLDENKELMNEYRLSLASLKISSGIYRLQYNLSSNKNTSESPACTLICSAMGDSLLIAVSAEDGKHARHVILNWKDQGYVVPYSNESSSSSSSVDKASEHGIEEVESLKVGDYVEITPRQDIIILSAMGRTSLSESGSRRKFWKVEHGALKKVWNILKDSIALPMLTAACFSAGFQPPAGLLTLPTEVKVILLGLLAAIDLAALGATCTELRHVTSTDGLWKPLFTTDFPVPPVEIADAALKKGYKWAYGHCFIERRRAEEERQRRRQRRYVVPGGLPLGPRPPYYPIPAPRGFPGVIGGDRDRLPFLPGPPPGRFGGGGGGYSGFGGGGGGGKHRWY
jgi:hypothetical protein